LNDSVISSIKSFHPLHINKQQVQDNAFMLLRIAALFSTDCDQSFGGMPPTKFTS